MANEWEVSGTQTTDTLCLETQGVMDWPLPDLHVILSLGIKHPIAGPSCAAGFFPSGVAFQLCSPPVNSTGMTSALNSETLSLTSFFILWLNGVSDRTANQVVIILQRCVPFSRLFWGHCIMDFLRVCLMPYTSYSQLLLSEKKKGKLPAIAPPKLASSLWVSYSEVFNTKGFLSW